MIGFSRNAPLDLSRFASSLLALMILFGCGCNPADKKQPEEEQAKESKPDVSDVPLRIQIVAEVSDAERIKRQWLSVSSQPVDIQAIELEEFLAEDKCESDIVLYPAQLIGEMVKREWVSPLLQDDESEDESGRFVAAATTSQAAFGKTKYGLPLGCSIPALIGSTKLAADLEADNSVSWEQLLASIGSGDSVSAIENADEEALLDRFFGIVATLSDRNPKYGLLFEMQDMKSRLREAEFLQACSVLQAIAKQPGGDVLAAGSHNDAWKMICESNDALLTVGVPTMLNSDIAALQGAVPIQVKRSGELAGWNTGFGLLASISTRCRQTSRANQFIYWLAKPSTLDALAPVVIGIDAEKAVAGPEAASWQVRQASRSAYSQTSLPREPCLPQAAEYRNALSSALLDVLNGTSTAEEALNECHEDWSDISGNKRSTLRDAYEKSLGLGI